MTSNEQMAKALQEFKPSEYYSQFKAPRKPLLGKLGKLTLLAYFGLTCFALGQFIEFHTTGIDFFIEGIGGYFWEYK
tara:strand:- start:2786 stop:3016 length:231 start_codon:yes stop_codon:yes gene_type:complete